MVTCDETRKLLDAYADQELFLNDSIAIEKHLRVCKHCDARYKNIVALQQATKKCGRHSPPADMQDRIQQKLKSETRQRIRLDRLWHDANWFKFAVPSFAVGVLSTALLSYTLSTTPQRHTFVDEVVASHIRSMMETHLTDVASSDKHQVKPWMNKVLDYSPPVEDLTHIGYPLIGARLDYINQRKVVSLVYKLRNHYINLFIWPSENGNEEGTLAESQKGYALSHWVSRKLVFTAISDINENDLMHFVQSFRAATRTL